MDCSGVQHPVVQEGTLDYEYCAELHNALWKLAWTGSTQDPWPNHPPTWWEYFNPPDTVASRLSENLIEFFKRAYYRKGLIPFYLLLPLTPCDELLEDCSLRDYGVDRFLFLHHATGFNLGDEMGLIYDQLTAKAAFVPRCEDATAICERGYGWKPLEDIYNAYLEMIQDGKVEVLSSPDATWSRQGSRDDWGPFRIYEFTPLDIDRSVCALRRLLHGIESRRGISSQYEAEKYKEIVLPWADPTTLDALGFKPETFGRRFLSETTKLSPVKFHYIAPGIRIQTQSELISSLLHYKPGSPPYKTPPPLLLFRADEPSRSSHPSFDSLQSTQVKDIFSRCLEYPAIRPGLYLSNNDLSNFPFHNECQLVLPFGIGAAGWARLSDQQGLGVDDESDPPEPRDVNNALYQRGNSGFGPYHDVPLHKVLDSWAERVEAGDWAVGEDGVLGGIEKFREADTREAWEKYWIPPSW